MHKKQRPTLIRPCDYYLLQMSNFFVNLLLRLNNISADILLTLNRTESISL